LARLAAYGIGLEDVRFAISNANVAGPKGSFDGAHQSYTIAANDQIAAADAYRSVVVTYRNGAPVLLSDVANVLDSLEDIKVGGWYDGTPAVIVDVQRQPGANVIETVQRVRAELPKLQHAAMAASPSRVCSEPVQSACEPNTGPGYGRAPWSKLSTPELSANTQRTGVGAATWLPRSKIEAARRQCSRSFICSS